MSHMILHHTYPATRTLRSIADEVVDYVHHHGDGYGTDAIRMPTEKVFDSYDAAEEYIRSVDKGWYDGIAVKFLDFSDVKATSKVSELQEKIRETEQKKKEYIAAHSVKTQKAAYIGCPKCGSKLNREMLRGESCPLCRTDLRSATTLERIASFDNRIKEYSKKIGEERLKDKKKAKVTWLVKFEYHC